MNLLPQLLLLALTSPSLTERSLEASALVQDRADSYEAIKERELAGLVTRLAEHAEWCKKKKLWLQRALALEALLEFTPDNLEARRALGHKKQRDGSWTSKKGPRPVDRSKKDLEEALQRRVELSGPFVEALKALYMKGGPDLTIQVQGKIIGDVLAVDPEDVWAHAERYEVKFEGEWVMMEVANAASGREELRALEQKLREELKPAKISLFTTLEDELELKFKPPLQGGSVRVLGTVEEEELKQCSDNLRVAKELLQVYTGERCVYTDGFTYFLLKSEAEKAAFLKSHPKVEEADRAFYQTLESVTLTGAQHFGSWSDNGPRRLDSACRQGISNLLYHGHQVTGEQGWVFEGVGLYFTHVVAKTHLTWFVSPSRYMSAKDDAAFREKLSRSSVNWLDEARVLMKEDKLPKFHTIVGRGLNRLSTEDLLLCNAAVAYFVEGRPGVLPKILKKLGRGRTEHEVFLEELGMDLMQFDKRLRKWLVETAD
jgi:nucleotide-binding universal stress UspA family protein